MTWIWIFFLGFWSLPLLAQESLSLVEADPSILNAKHQSILQKALTQHQTTTGQSILFLSRKNIQTKSLPQLFEPVIQRYFGENVEKEENSIILLLDANNGKIFSRTGLRIETNLNEFKLPEQIDLKKSNSAIFRIVSSLLYDLNSPVIFTAPPGSEIVTNLGIKAHSKSVNYLALQLLILLGVFVFLMVVYFILSQEKMISSEGAVQLGPFWLFQFEVKSALNNKSMTRTAGGPSGEW